METVAAAQLVRCVTGRHQHVPALLRTLTSAHGGGALAEGGDRHSSPLGRDQWATFQMVISNTAWFYINLWKQAQE